MKKSATVNLMFEDTSGGNLEIVDGSIYAGINPPAFADIYPGTNNAYNNGTGYGLNLCLKWETTEQYNIGIDFELLEVE
jgi:hypothetical protein